MADIRTYPEGSTFTGEIGRTASESTAAWPVPPSARSGAPNVMFILLDDVGFAQLGCFGADIHTPTFDRLAAGGLRYRDFHTTAICSPTRSCLLTGRNHHSNGVGIIQEMATGFPGYNGSVPRENGFLSEMLLREGYATFAVGKWHLTLASEYASGASKARWPLPRGFERYYGFLGGKTSQWAPTLVSDNHYVDPPNALDESYHLNADLADRAIEFVTDLRAVAPNKPFFLYYCLGAGHSPHHVEREWIEKYRGQFDSGWDHWRETVFQRQLEMGIVPPGTRLSPRPDWVPAWDSLSDDERRLYARQMEVYAAFLEQTDHHIGRVISFLEEAGELDNTLIFLTSDNGASSEGGPFGSFNENCFPNRVESTVEDNLARIDDWGGVRSFPNYSWGWAWAGNTPLKRWKRYLHQGGMSDPLIVHWPKGIEARGEVRGQYTHVVDIVPTVLELLGLNAPAEIGGVAQKPIEGVSFADTFGDPAAPTRKSVQYYEMIGSRAIWTDGWKAVAEQEQGVVLTEAMLDAQRWELYHVAEDFSECVDLAAQYPEKLKELIALWWDEAAKYNVLPLDSRMQARMAEPKPLAARTSNRYVYYPGGAPMFEYTAVNLKNRSHTITAYVEIPEGGAEGVLLAHGSWFAGYSLYVQGGRLHYVHNYLGLAEYRVSAERPLSAGPATLRFRFRKTGEHRGIGTLYVGDEQVGEGEIPQTVPGVIETSSEGLCCGYDSGLPVTDRYQSPFRFTGAIKRVVVEVDGVESVDPDAQLRAAFSTQQSAIWIQVPRLWRCLSTVDGEAAPGRILPSPEVDRVLMKRDAGVRARAVPRTGNRTAQPCPGAPARIGRP